MMPSSMTRFVEASSKAMAETRLAPFWKMERASATAAYEHELEAIPNKVARVRFFGESPPSAFAIAWWETTAWTTPERAKPSTSGQRISHNMLQAITSA